MMNTIEEITQTLDALILEGHSDYSELDLNETTDIVDDLFYDSINIMKLIVAIEYAYDIQVPDEKLDLSVLRKYSLIKELVFSLILEKEQNKDDHG